jgi:autoinducer 2-binding protein LuxP
MRLVIVVFLSFFLFSQASAFQNIFYTVNEYLIKHPEQAWKSDAFKDIVTGTPQPMQHMNPKPVRIAVVYPGRMVSDFWLGSLKAVERRLQELNVNYSMLVYESSTENDVRTQVANIANARDKEVDFIITATDTKQVRNVIGKLLAENKINVIIQNQTSPLKAWRDSQPLLYTGFDHIDGSRLIADKVVELFPNGASYAILCFDGEAGYQRTKGFVERLQLHDGFIRLAEYDVAFNSEKAYSATMDMLNKYPEVEYIFTCSNDIAIGSASALRDAGKADKIILSGWGGSASEIDLIAIKELDFTVVRMSGDSGIAIAEAIKMVLEGKRRDIPQIFNGELRIVSSDDAPETIKALKTRITRYIDETKQ